MIDWLSGGNQRKDWQWEIGLQSETGRVRQHNEDYVEYAIPEDEEQLYSKGSIFVVADGMGGHQAGEVASQEAVERIMTAYYANTTSSVGESMVAAFEQANQDVFGLAQTDSTKAGMGTTVVAAVILGSKAIIANVGDSRAYLLRRNRLRQITVDHSWVEVQVQSGILTREQAALHPQRNLITRALGTRPSVDVDLFQVDLRRGDTLLLCTDGLSGQVQDQKLAHSIRTMPPQQAAMALVEQANAHGGRDNASVVIVQAGSGRETVGLQWFVESPKFWNSRHRLLAKLILLIFVCLCVLAISILVAKQLNVF